ncbi:MAG: HAD hydrolase family protein, partial [Lachnospiraceae bacterium]|nr:HAD hydrolase family protein [Lachnospiraceae bacterium]
KASCMDDIVEYLNNSGKYPEKISIEDTVAIGDSNNDLPMLEHAGCAIAMGESSDQVLKMADFVTANVMDDGIYKALEWLGCI